MTADVALFSPAPARRPLPRRDRSSVPSGCVRFGPDDTFALYVTPDAVAQLRQGTSRRAPNEAFGLLAGRSFVDQHGAYTIVTGAIYAQSLSAGPGHVQLAGAEMEELRRRLMIAFPGADIVGWTHSHHQPSDYSPVDRAEQTTWPDEHNVGLLTFMAGEPWARAYHGPRSRPLGMAPRTAIVVQPALRDAAPSQPLRPAPAAPLTPPLAGTLPTQHSPQLGWVATALAFALAGVLFSGGVLLDHVAQLDDRLAAVEARSTVTNQQLSAIAGRLVVLDHRLTVAPTATALPTATPAPATRPAPTAVPAATIRTSFNPPPDMGLPVLVQPAVPTPYYQPRRSGGPQDGW